METDLKKGRELLCEIMAMFSRSEVPEKEWPDIPDVFAECNEAVRYIFCNTKFGSYHIINFNHVKYNYLNNS